MPLKKYLFPVLLIVCLMPFQGKAYSVLTHEAIIDASWEKSLKPLILKRYPGLSEADIRLAHSYAYGGSLMADIGYSPFGSEYFTNLIHYVRTGDFVNNLISESENVNEFAYALGALCHYMADQYGHSLGTNVVVPITYPDVKKKFGPVATYDEDHTAHSRVEIAFDVLQVARGNYASQAYHDFIGFNVAKPVLEKAFLKTYGQDINTIFPNLDKSINNFRWAINSLMPTVTRSAWLSKRDEIKKTEPGVTARKFHYRMQRKKYYGEFGRDRDKIEFKQQLLAFFLKIVPKVGPFKIFKFKPIGHEGEIVFIKSFDEVTRRYEEALGVLDYQNPHLPNVDFDTGGLTTYGEYGLATKTYDDLLEQLDKTKYVSLTQSLKTNVTDFYSKADTLTLAKNEMDYWKKRRVILQHITAANTVPVDSLRTTNKVNDKVIAIKLDH